MALNFTLRLNLHKKPSIIVLRAVVNELGRIKKFATLGTLKSSDDKTVQAFIKTKELDRYEQFQLQSYLANLKFNEEAFSATADDLVPQKFFSMTTYYEEALFKLWDLAQQYNISFNPIDVQQRTLLDQAKAVEKELNKKLDKPVNVISILSLAGNLPDSSI